MTSSTVDGILSSFIAGVGASAGWSPVMVWSQKLCPERRGLMVGIMETGTKLCPFLIALAIPCVIPLFSWREVWLGIISSNGFEKDAIIRSEDHEGRFWDLC